MFLVMQAFISFISFLLLKLLIVLSEVYYSMKYFYVVTTYFKLIVNEDIITIARETHTISPMRELQFQFLL